MAWVGKNRLYMKIVLENTDRHIGKTKQIAFYGRNSKNALDRGSSGERTKYFLKIFLFVVLYFHGLFFYLVLIFY